MTPRRHGGRHMFWLFTGGTALSLLVVACGDDDDGSAAEPSESTRSSAATTDGQAATEVEPHPDDPYCDVERQIDSIFEQEFGRLEEASTEDEVLAAIQAGSQRVIDEGLAEQGEELVPDEIGADVGVLIAAVRDAAEGDFDAMSSSEVADADARVDTYCDSAGDPMSGT